jgi:hypothetical protein
MVDVDTPGIGQSTLWSEGVGLFGAQTIEPDGFSTLAEGRDVDVNLGSWAIAESEVNASPDDVSYG